MQKKDSQRAGGEVFVLLSKEKRKYLRDRPGGEEMKKFFIALCVLLFSSLALAGPGNANRGKSGTNATDVGKAVFTHDLSSGRKLQVSLTGGNNKDDVNSYGVSLKTALGFVNVMPRLVFSTDRSLTWNQDDDARKTSEFTLALDGEKDFLEFEGEFDYQNVDYSGIAGPKDVGNLDVYGNIWANLDAGKIGLLFAYGARDDNDEGRFSFGDDLDGAIFLGQTVPTFHSSGVLKPSGLLHHGIAGVTLAQVYARMAIGDKLHVKPSLTYFADKLKKFSADEYEVNLSAGYKITDMMTYEAAIAFSKIDAKADRIDADNIDGMSFFQKFVLDF
jgi:hypothetical protein